MATKKGKIRIGFDFDGVLFYNPIRLLRPVLDLVKKYILHVPSTTFYVAKTKNSYAIMRLVHASSFMPNVGLGDFLKLLSDPEYDVFVVTARQKFLMPDLYRLLSLYGVHIPHERIFCNTHDEQAHVFKERMTKELKLDFYVEDNWDIVNYLRLKTKTRVVWLFNRVDKLFIHDTCKAPNVKEAIELILRFAKKTK
ncbi:MAG: hypothetical protein NUV65_02665 [Candidatus Roizmanbacteria bacterium]|nr:hypothetical protein [Candidatus Roizmanbacteria bacterium]